VILLETSLLSYAYRRRSQADPEPKPVARLRELIEANAPLAIPGIVLQEMLSGLRDDKQAVSVRESIQGFPVILATENDHRTAANVLETSRRSGKTISTVDGLIAAMAITRGASLFTMDGDFSHIPASCGLKLLR